MDVDFAQLTGCGRVRACNEDYLGYVAPATAREVRTHGWLFALADGTGGEDMGEIASRAAVEYMLDGFRSAPGGEAHSLLLPRLVQDANAHVLDTGLCAALGGAAMATTIVACALRSGSAVVAHVGNSRCYLVRHGRAVALTSDHTVANEEVRLGVLSARASADFVACHTLTRSLGSDLFVDVDISHHRVMAGDVLVLCSDGLHGAVSAEEIADLVSYTESLETAAEEMAAIANERDGSDNISLQLVRVRGDGQMGVYGMYRGRPYKLR